MGWLFVQFLNVVKIVSKNSLTVLHTKTESEIGESKTNNQKFINTKLGRVLDNRKLKNKTLK